MTVGADGLRHTIGSPDHMCQPTVCRCDEASSSPSPAGAGFRSRLGGRNIIRQTGGFKDPLSCEGKGEGADDYRTRSDSMSNSTVLEKMPICPNADIKSILLIGSG
jgi:hypothetical protein